MPPREKRTAPIQVQFTISEKDAITAAAVARGISASTLMRNIALQWLKDNEPDKGEIHLR